MTLTLKFSCISLSMRCRKSSLLCFDGVPKRHLRAGLLAALRFTGVQGAAWKGEAMGDRSTSMMASRRSNGALEWRFWHCWVTGQSGSERVESETKDINIIIVATTNCQKTRPAKLSANAMAFRRAQMGDNGRELRAASRRERLLLPVIGEKVKFKRDSECWRDAQGQWQGRGPLSGPLAGRELSENRVGNAREWHYAW